MASFTLYYIRAGEKWEESYGLLYERELLKDQLRAYIILVGSAKSGKTEIIQTFFRPNPAGATMSTSNCDKYHMLLGHNPRFDESSTFELIIIDAKTIDFATEANFVEKTVILFCYEKDDEDTFRELKITYIPAFFGRRMDNIYYFSVGIEHEPISDTESEAGIRQQERRTDLRESEQRMIEERGGRPLDCSISNRDSVLTVFQTALETMYPSHS